MQDEDYMRIALDLAKKGVGWAAPNPLVGAVIVKDGLIIGSGYHRCYGEEHAERNALSACSQRAEGAVMYVTLEPCCHYGKQPPCTEAILEAGIRRVVVGSEDPNPLVGGKGIRILREQGVEVTQGVLKEECDRLNEIFFHFVRTKRPFVMMKYAMTMDGKIAAYTGESKWITGEAARRHVHEQRHRCSAVMAGVGTVLKDDPLLTCRLENGKNPVRIICDSRLRTPLASQVVRTAGQVPTIIATCCTDSAKILPYQDAGCRILVTGQVGGHVDLRELMERLGEENIDSVILEGGGTLNWSALRSGIVQKVQAYIAPKVFGGREAKSPVEGRGVPSPSDAVMLENSTVVSLGEDFLIESEVKTDVYRNC